MNSPLTYSSVQTAYRLAQEADPEQRAGMLDGAMALEENLNERVVECATLRAANKVLAEALQSALSYAHEGLKADVENETLCVAPSSAIAKIRAALQSGSKP